MSVQFLVDTDWAIHYLHGNAEIVRQLNDLKTQGLGLSVISLAELYEGVYFSTEPQKNEEELNDFLRGVALIGIDVETCKIFGNERGRLRAAKRMIGDFDLLIASTALQHSLTLLTNNRRHFEAVDRLAIRSA
jgi:tRNA(fMet)-specific endonuclease VapC